MKNSYNYACVEDYKQKIVIPIIALEFEGWLPFLACTVGTIAGTIVFGIPLALLLGNIMFFLSFTLSFVGMMIFSHFSSERDEETGRTSIEKFYYTRIRKLKCIYGSDGREHYLQKKVKGVVYMHACR